MVEDFLLTKLQIGALLNMKNNLNNFYNYEQRFARTIGRNVQGEALYFVVYHAAGL